MIANMYFGPDLASEHYAKNTIEIYEAVGINFGPKQFKPPNVPQFTPIENFCVILSEICTRMARHVIIMKI
jgi:hypothetical protein